jgi:hypothetical protein
VRDAVGKDAMETYSDVEVAITPTPPHSIDHNLLTQVVGVAILEFGVVLHR